MSKLALFLTLFFSMTSFALSDRQMISGKDTTPRKVVCSAPGVSGGILVQFVKDKEADPGVYTVKKGIFYPANKIKRVSYELYKERWSKVGHLDNGGKVRLYFPEDAVLVAGELTGSNAGDDIKLENCQDLQLK